MSNDPFSPSEPTPRPLPPSENPTTPFETVDTQATSVGLAPNVEAGLCAVFTILGGLFFILQEKKNQFVRFWAMQSIFFGAAWFITLFVLGFVSAILVNLFNIIFVVTWIVTIYQAFNGKSWELPVLGKMAREQLSRTPPR